MQPQIGGDRSRLRALSGRKLAVFRTARDSHYQPPVEPPSSQDLRSEPEHLL